MKAIVAAGLVCGLLAVTASEAVANGQSRRYGERGWRGHPYCFLMRRSPILDLASVGDMRAAVEQRYEHALKVSVSERVIFSRRPVFPWAVEAKAACGRAIGFFRGREVNAVMISKCDCYHGRMLAHLRR